MKFRWKTFGADLRSTRELIFMQGLREAAKAARVSHSTWSRAERGLPIEAPTFLFLCQWMNRNPARYMVRRWLPER